MEHPPAGAEPFLRWSRGPEVDLPDGGSSRDTLTGIALPGLSAHPLAAEAWWGDRPRRVRAARRLYDHRHLHQPGVRSWVPAGEVGGRGPDNGPLVRRDRPVAWIADAALLEAQRVVDDLGAGSRRRLDRIASRHGGEGSRR